MNSARRATLLVAGLVIGAVSALVELAYLVLSIAALAVPAARAGVFAGAYRITVLEQRRLTRFLGELHTAEYTGQRALRYLSVRWMVGFLGAGIVLLMGFGAVAGVIMAYQLMTGQALGGVGTAAWYETLAFLPLAAVLVFVTVQGMVGAAALDRRLAYTLLGLSEAERLRRRVRELTTSRADVVEAVNDERRRIERALHDGVQQRLVGLGMMLGRAQRTTERERARRLLRDAHDEAQQTLHDLRELTWRVYPVALDDGGLRPALEALTERNTMPVVLRYDLAQRPSKALETIAYFVVAEALTNAVKHAGADRLEIEVARTGTLLVVRITDDGVGGATSNGSGLSGLARRVGAEDGELTVVSPPGGPTTITAMLPSVEHPCGS